ncbi:MAG: hypothetical protein GOV02_03555 [Candidatus Aenigmarchaeota archaeon]|nr:hypothetical protein [Candidatus Aenigmarchaeota archaeon]
MLTFDKGSKKYFALDDFEPGSTPFEKFFLPTPAEIARKTYETEVMRAWKSGTKSTSMNNELYKTKEQLDINPTFAFRTQLNIAKESYEKLSDRMKGVETKKALKNIGNHYSCFKDAVESAYRLISNRSINKIEFLELSKIGEEMDLSESEMLKIEYEVTSDDIIVVDGWA